MNKTLVLLLTTLLILAGCAGGPLTSRGVPFDPEKPKVYVIDQQIVVDQEPIYVTRKGATIVWELPKDQKLTFPSDGIVIKAERNEFDCKVGESATTFSCRWDNAKPRVFYKYAIKVKQEGKDLRPLDPSIVGDF